MSDAVSRISAVFDCVLAEVRRNPRFADEVLRALDAPAPAVVSAAEKPNADTVAATSMPTPPGGDIQKPRGGRRAPGVLNPFDALREGSETLVSRLKDLNVEQLKDIIAEHGMDQSKLAMKWKSQDRLVEFIVSTVANRARKGEVFRNES